MVDPSEDKQSPVENPGSGTRGCDEENTRDRPVVPSSSFDSGSTPPLPLPSPVAHPPVAQPSRAQAGQSGGRPSKKKGKTEKEAMVDVVQEPGKKRKSASLENLPLRARTCGICKREFATARALFGHMRSHPGRGWIGAHPPPISPSREEAQEGEPEGVEEARQVEDIASSLLDIGQRILRTEKFKGIEGVHMGESGVVAEGGNSLTTSNIVSGHGIGAEIGWINNKEMAVESLNYTTDEDRRKQIHYQLDLNKEAPMDDEDEDNHDDDKDKTMDATSD